MKQRLATFAVLLGLIATGIGSFYALAALGLWVDRTFPDLGTPERFMFAQAFVGAVALFAFLFAACIGYMIASFVWQFADEVRQCNRPDHRRFEVSMKRRASNLFANAVWRSLFGILRLNARVFGVGSSVELCRDLGGMFHQRRTA